jgi:NADPH2:quinone reductase
MKAIRVHEFGKPEVMRLEESPAPTPGRGQLAVRIIAAGVNPVDTYIRSGQYARLPELPYTPGIDGAGVVEGVGADVRRFQVGDRVYVAGSISGAYAERAVCGETQAHPLPERLSFQQGAAVGVPYTAAYRALFHRADAKPGETLLVHGATGGVGTAATQLGRAAGLTVIGTGGTEQGRELARAQGAHHVVDHGKDGYVDEILELTDGRGADVIVELLANVNLANDLKLLNQGGRVAVIGSRGTVEIDPRDAMKRDASIMGLLVFNASEDELVRIHAALGAGFENGSLSPVIGKEFQLSQAVEAHRAVMQSGAYGKIILVS